MLIPFEFKDRADAGGTAKVWECLPQLRRRGPAGAVGGRKNFHLGGAQLRDGLLNSFFAS